MCSVSEIWVKLGSGKHRVSTRHPGPALRAVGSPVDNDFSKLKAGEHRRGAVRPAWGAWVIILFLSGCSHWEKPGGTEGEFDATKASCIARGFARFPPATQQIPITGGYSTSSQTNCMTLGSGNTANTSCTTTPGQYVPPVTMPVDHNQTARNADFQACLYENGWSNVRNR